MSTNLLKDSVIKILLRIIWRWLVGIQCLVNLLFYWMPYRLRLNYGGARPGNIGGSLVKIQRIKLIFPEFHFGFNLLYLLSNSPYIPGSIIKTIKFFNFPIVLNQNGVFYPAWFDGDYAKQNKLMSVAYHEADYVFWQSEFCRQAADRFLGVREKAGEILFNAVDLEKFYPKKINRGNDLTFLVAGKIDAHLVYRVKSAILGLSYARKKGLNAKLIIAGKVELLDDLLLYCKEHGVQDEVSFLGAYTQDQAPDIYRAADVYVITKYMDPCPNTVIEAMACGLPVLYSVSGGIPELVGPGAGVGLRVPIDWNSIHIPTDIEIGNGMIEISRNLGEMAILARERAVEKFDMKIWIDRHKIIFDHFTKGSK